MADYYLLGGTIALTLPEFFDPSRPPKPSLPILPHGPKRARNCLWNWAGQRVGFVKVGVGLYNNRDVIGHQMLKENDTEVGDSKNTV